MTITRNATFKSILLAATILAGPLTAMAPSEALAQVALGISVELAPPALPVYDQPPMPDVGYIWTPGYWAYADPAGYYWVPGTWVQPPTVGVLWTPPYWGWLNGAYVFNAGYWGPHVGFYGGIDYGFGYGGRGYDGGRWDHGRFDYNQRANNFGSVHVTNTYTRNVTVINNTHVSYAGGTGGLRTQPTAAERAAVRESHTPVTAEQTRHVEAARGNPDFAASHNNGHPAIAATARPGQFEGAGVTHARAAGAPGPAIRPQATRPGAASPAAAHDAQPRPDHTAAAPGPAIRPRPDHSAGAPATQPRPDHTAGAPAAQPRPDHTAAAPGPAIRPQPDHTAAAPAPQPRPDRAAAAPAPQPRPQPQHAAAPAVQPRPAQPAAARAVAPPPRPAQAHAAPPPRPAQPAATHAAPPPRPPAQVHAAPPPRPAPPAAARGVPAKPPAEAEKDKKPD